MVERLYKKVLVVGIILLFIVVGFQPQFSIALPSSLEKLSSIRYLQNCNRTLITEFGKQKVIEVDSLGAIVWLFAGLRLPSDAERLPNGNTLIADYQDGHVIEVDSEGNEVWKVTGLHKPMDAERLNNSNTLIVEAEIYPDGCVLEVDSEGNEVWNISNLNGPLDAERLENGNTLIVEYLDDRIIEVDNSGNIVWELDGLDKPMDVEKMDTGILITEYLGGQVFGGGWEITGLDRPIDAEPLENGNILIAESGRGRIIEVNSNGDIVWELTGFTPYDIERLNNQPPKAPIIDGPCSGRRGQTLTYTFNALDPDRDDIRFHIDWNDGKSDVTSFVASDTEKTVSHTWDCVDIYTITAYAEDEYGNIGPFSTFTVIITRTKAINKPILNFIQSHPN